MTYTCVRFVLSSLYVSFKSCAPNLKPRRIVEICSCGDVRSFRLAGSLSAFILLLSCSVSLSAQARERPLRQIVPSVGSASAFAATKSAATTAATGLSVDVHTSNDVNSASGTVTSPVFSTASAAELLLAFVATDSSGSPNTVVQSVSGGGLTWVLVIRTNTQSGTSEIWRAFAPAILRSASVSARLSQTVDSSITVMSFAGVNPTGINGSGAVGSVGSYNATSGAPKAALTTSNSNSLVVGVGNDYDRAVARQPDSGQTIVHQDLSSSQDTYWVQQSAAIPVSGTRFALGDSAPTSDRFNWSICEVLQATTSQTSQASLSATTLSFGSVRAGSSATQSLTVNSTGTQPVTINSASVSGTGFSLVAGSFPVTLSPGHSLTLQTQFLPKAVGSDTGQLIVSSNSATGGTAVVGLTGAGTADPQLGLSASSVSFGNVTVGASATQSLKLTSNGLTAVTLQSAPIAGVGFTVSGSSFPLTLSPAQTVTLSTTFKPTATGTATGQLNIDSNSVTGSVLAVALSGTGVTAQHSIGLTWSAPGSSPVPVVGYHVYRAISSGTPVLLNSTLDTQTAYTDTSVASGTSYSYLTKSVDATGLESAPSNQITLTVP